jgi:CHASE3 domain sensor protein
MNSNDEATEILREIRDSLREMQEHAEKAEERTEEFRAVAIQQQRAHIRLYFRALIAAGVLLLCLFYFLYAKAR